MWRLMSRQLIRPLMLAFVSRQGHRIHLVVLERARAANSSMITNSGSPNTIKIKL